MTVLTNKYIIVLLLLPFINIKLINDLSAIKYGMQFFVSLVGYLILFDEIKYNRKRINHPLVLLILLYSLIIFLSGLINRNLTYGIIFICFIYPGVYIYINYCILKFKDFIGALVTIFSIVFVINIFLAIYFQNSYVYQGIDKVFIGIFTGKNAISMIIIPALSFFLIESQLRKNKITIKSIAYCVLGLIIVNLSHSSTAMVIGVLFILYILFLINKKLNINALVIVYITIYFGLIIFRIHEIVLGDFIVNVLGKSTTLTGRTFLWDYVLGIIPQSFILGFGNNNNLILTNNILDGVKEVHNGFLEIILCTGIIGLILFAFILVIVIRKLKKNDNKVSYIISMSIFLYLCIGLTESAFTYDKIGFWILLIMGANVDKIIKQYKTENDTTELSIR